MSQKLNGQKVNIDVLHVSFNYLIRHSYAFVEIRTPMKCNPSYSEKLAWIVCKKSECIEGFPGKRHHCILR